MSDIAIAHERQKSLSVARRQENSPVNFHVPQKPENHSQGGNKADHSERLEAARKNSIPKMNAKNAVSAVKNLASAASLWKYVDLITDMPIIGAFGAALLKDLLDLVTFETVILPMLFAVLCSIFIFMMLLLIGANGKKKGASKMIQKMLFLVGGGIADGVPGLDFLPIETATVGAVYYTTLVERKDAAQE